MSLQEAIKSKLSAGLQSMGLVISAEQEAQLLAYILLIDKWNKVHNLTAIRDPLAMVTLHILDALSVLDAVQKLQPRYLLDVGAGAGLPSIPLAICLPNLHVVAIDAVQKKASFMRQAKAELQLSHFSVESGRVEALKKERFNAGAGFDVVISRAFSEIALFVKLTQHLIAADGVWFAMKGVVPTLEFEKAGIMPDEIKPLKVAGLEAERHLIVIKNNVVV
jgi:16S rRNA (guanine527-N7)-methyltransferase